MHLYERERGQNKGLFLAVVVFVLLVVLFLFFLLTATQRNEANEREMMSDALRRAIVTCYSVEGKYPPSLDYIYENYGVRIDENRYVVFYDVIAANVMPSVDVISIGGGA